MDSWSIGLPIIDAVLLAGTVDTEAGFPFVDVASGYTTLTFEGPDRAHDFVTRGDSREWNDRPVIALRVGKEFIDHGTKKLRPIGLAACLMKVESVVVSKASRERERMNVG